MNINIHADNIELTNDIREYVEKRLKGIEPLIADDPDPLVEVKVSKTTNHHKSGDIFRIDVNVTAYGELFNVESEQSDVFSAVDIAKDELVQEIKKMKGKKRDQMKRGGQKLKSLLKGFFRK